MYEYLHFLVIFLFQTKNTSKDIHKIAHKSMKSPENLNILYYRSGALPNYVSPVLCHFL